MQVQAVDLNELEEQAELVALWDEEVKASRNLYAMYQSRHWLRCLQGDAVSATQLLVARSPESERVGIVPIALGTTYLKFQASRRAELSWRFECIEVLGNEVLGDAGYECYRAMISAVWNKYPKVEAIYFKSVPNDSDLWQILRGRGWRFGETLAYKPEGERPFHYLALPDTFEEYMSVFKKKQRYNLKRQVRVLSEAFSNTLALTCITQPEDLDLLVESVVKVSEKSWKAIELEKAAPDVVYKPSVLADIAEKGLLRSYILRVNGEPCAYVVGYRFNGIYHYANIGYDASLSSYSPGNVLLMLVIENLIEAGGMKFMNFGVTDAEYKRIFGNRHITDASLLLLRPGVRNGAKRLLHQSFLAGKRLVKKIIRKQPSSGEDA